MRTYKLYTAVSSNAACYVTVQRSGRIKSIRYSIRMNSVTNGHALSMEVSTQPVAQIAAHDTQGSIDEVGWFNNVGAAGTDHGNIVEQRVIDFPVVAGERIYLNTSFTVTAAYITVFVDIAD